MVPVCQTELTIYCSFYLFQFHGQFVEINLVGAVVPITVSLLFLGLLAEKNIVRIIKYSLLICLLYTLAWSGTDAIAGGISTPGPVVEVLFCAVSFVWVYFNSSYVTNKTLNSLVLQTYATGTFGVLFADITRMTASLLTIPVLQIQAPLLVIGGAGPLDGVFLGGLYFIFFMMLSVTALRVFKTWRQSRKLVTG